MKGLNFLVIAAFPLCMSCKHSSEKAGGLYPVTTGKASIYENIILSREAVEDISGDIESTVETSVLLTGLSVPFSPDLIAFNNTSGVPASEFSRALCLGMIGADLHYINYYGKTRSYAGLPAIASDMAGSLNAGPLFRQNKTELTWARNRDRDSVIVELADSYNRYEKMLRENGRGDLSALILTGSWIENQYHLVSALDNYTGSVLDERIAEQKPVLVELVQLTAPLCDSVAGLKELCAGLYRIRDAYREVKLTFTQGVPETREMNGGIVVVQTEKSTAVITREQLNEIAAAIKETRNNLITNN